MATITVNDIPFRITGPQLLFNPVYTFGKAHGPLSLREKKGGRLVLAPIDGEGNIAVAPGGEYVLLSFGAAKNVVSTTPAAAKTSLTTSQPPTTGRVAGGSSGQGEEAPQPPPAAKTTPPQPPAASEKKQRQPKAPATKDAVPQSSPNLAPQRTPSPVAKPLESTASEAQHQPQQKNKKREEPAAKRRAASPVTSPESDDDVPIAQRHSDQHSAGASLSQNSNSSAPASKKNKTEAQPPTSHKKKEDPKKQIEQVAVKSSAPPAHVSSPQLRSSPKVVPSLGAHQSSRVPLHNDSDSSDDGVPLSKRVAVVPVTTRQPRAPAPLQRRPPQSSDSDSD